MTSSHGIPDSVTQFDIQYSEDFHSTVFETEDGDFIGLNMTDKAEFLDHVYKIIEILQGFPYDGEDFSVEDVKTRRAISIENSYGEFTLQWGGVGQYTPFSFDVFHLSL